MTHHQPDDLLNSMKDKSIPDRVLASQPDGDPNILAERDQKVH